MMGQVNSVDDSIRHLRQSSLQPYIGRPAPALNIYNLDYILSRAHQAEKIEYIYCIKLPCFVCTPQSAPAQEYAAAQVQPLSELHSHCPRAVRRTRLRRYTPYSLNLRRSVTATPSETLGPVPRPFAGQWHDNVVRRQLLGALAVPPRPQWTPHEVVKIGKSENLARRFHEILGAFQNLPEVQVPLLQEINSTDDLQTVLRKAKLLESVIFLVKVKDIGTAENDIRNILGRSLGQGFINHFLECLNDEEQKKPFEDNSGMTEWVLMDAELATHLQCKFRFNELYRSYLHLLPQTPKGSDVHRQLRAHGINYYIRRNRSANLPPRFHISFRPTNFSYTLQI